MDNITISFGLYAFLIIGATLGYIITGIAMVNIGMVVYRFIMGFFGK